MNVLFAVPYVPTPIRVRPYNLLKSLAGRGHSVTLATLWTDAAERETLSEVAGWGVRVIAERLPRWRALFNCVCALPTSTPLQGVYCRSLPLHDRIRAELQASRGKQNGSTPWSMWNICGERTSA